MSATEDIEIAPAPAEVLLHQNGQQPAQLEGGGGEEEEEEYVEEEEVEEEQQAPARKNEESAAIIQSTVTVTTATNGHEKRPPLPLPKAVVSHEEPSYNYDDDGGSHKKKKKEALTKRLMRYWFWFGCLVFSAGVLGLAVTATIQKAYDRVMIAWLCAGAFVGLTVPISLWQIYEHLHVFQNPTLQICVVRILWMVPIYAVESYIALRFDHAAMICAFLREFYEAYVIYNFFSYLLHYLGEETVREVAPRGSTMSRCGAYLWKCAERRVENPKEVILNEVEELAKALKRKKPVKHLMPLCMVRPWAPGKSFLRRCQFGVIQYVLVRVCTTSLAIALEVLGLYHSGEFEWNAGYPYLAFVNNASQIWAMYCLIYFYQGTKEELAAVRPIGKLMCIKAVVFFSFWQAVLIAALTSFNVITTSLVTPEGDGDAESDYTQAELGEALNNFITCLEMFVAALFHRVAFPVSEFQSIAIPADVELVRVEIDHSLELEGHKKSVMRAFVQSSVPASVAKDTVQIGRTAMKKMRKAVNVPLQTIPLVFDELSKLGATTDSTPRPTPTAGPQSC